MGTKNIELEYWAGNPSIEIINGIIRCRQQLEDRDTCATIVCRNVPNYMGPPEFIEFASPFSSKFEFVKVLHGSASNQYLMLIFCDATTAKDLLRVRGGQRYNRLEPHTCELSAVQEVTMNITSNSTEIMQTPASSVPPGEGFHEAALFLRQFERPVFCAVCLEQLEAIRGERDEDDDSETKPAAACRLRHDGVPINVLCGHTFHSGCLSQWCDTTCPVCRFQQHPFQASCCDVCGTTDAMLLCLICGFIGCGRQRTAATGVFTQSNEGETSHALNHFLETSHTYALEVATQRVWDFSRSGFVHRLLHNRTDGKVVEGPHQLQQPETSDTADESPWGGMHNLRRAEAHATNAGLRAQAELLRLQDKVDTADEQQDDAPMHWKDKKSEDLCMAEFNATLAAQLDSQREYYEERLKRMIAEISGPRRDPLREEELLLTAEVKELRDKKAQMCKHIGQLKDSSKSSCEREGILRSLVSDAEERHETRKVETRGEEEAAAARGSALENEVLVQAVMIQDLRNQVKDLRFHVGAMRNPTVSSSEGTLVVGEAQTRGRGRRGRRR